MVTAELHNTNNSLDRMAEIDGLTGIANRCFFEQMLGREWRRAKRNGKPLAILMIDIDHFKHYNDNYRYCLHGPRHG